MIYDPSVYHYRLIKQQCITFLFLFTGIQSILLLDIDVPPYVKEGSSVKLICIYEIELDGLYSLKWYKDEKEFYSYIPRQLNKKRFFDVTGVNIDKSQNLPNSTHVTLQNVTDASAGEYKCQVSGEGPLFATQTQTKQLRVAVVPKGPPYIINVPAEFSIGQWVNLNCTSEPSRPAARLTWIVNGHQAEDNMIRKFFSPTIPPTALLSTILPSRNQHQLTKQRKSVPKKQNSAISHNVDEDVAQRASQKTIRNQNQKLTLESRILALEFWLREEHFAQGRLVVKCVAEISGVYRDETANYVIAKHNVQHKVLQAISAADAPVRLCCSNFRSNLQRVYTMTILLQVLYVIFFQ